MIKRFILVAALTVITFVGFSFLSQSKAETSESENQEEEIDFQNIPLSEKQVKAVDLKMGEAQEREMDAMLRVNGSLVLRAQDMGNIPVKAAPMSLTPAARSKTSPVVWVMEPTTEAFFCWP